MENYWTHIKQDIAKKYNYGDPKNWSESDIKNFLDIMERTIIDYGKENKRKAFLCGITFKNEEARDLTKGGLWQIIDVTTFKRLLKKEDNSGHTRTKNLFAIYLGYDSVADYQQQTLAKIQEAKAINTPEAKIPAAEGKKKEKPGNAGLSLLWLALAAFLIFLPTRIHSLLENPLFIIGLVLLLLFGIHRLIINSGIIPPLDEKEGSLVLRLILKYGFYVALAIIGSGLLSAAFGFM